MYYSLVNEPLIELSNPGASGSLFYLTSDDEFIIKTVQHKEAKFLQRLLPGYYMNLNQNPRTLLPKFYGLYCIQSGGINIRLVVMNNVLPRSVRMNYMSGEKANPTYKDLDFQDMLEGLYFDAETYNNLMKTLQRDCRSHHRVYSSQSHHRVYSSQSHDRVYPNQSHHRVYSSQSTSQSLPQSVHITESTPVSHMTESTPVSHITESTPVSQSHITESTPVSPITESTPHASRYVVAEVEVWRCGGGGVEVWRMGGIPAKTHKDEKLLIFLGIIDILQSYRFIKKLEHSWKALVYDGGTGTSTGETEESSLEGPEGGEEEEEEEEEEEVPPLIKEVKRFRNLGYSLLATARSTEAGAQPPGIFLMADRYSTSLWEAGQTLWNNNNNNNDWLSAVTSRQHARKAGWVVLGILCAVLRGSMRSHAEAAFQEAH
ncbi:hypothetical protein CRUP_013033 [Coryphaenoides rupestris]|nr:hypothetical protein CRUP_013033 [Coryphaenoides rupestris]